MNIIRKRHSKCFIGNSIIGGESRISVQSMTNTPTRDTERTMKQCKKIIEEGADFVRIAVPTTKEVASIKHISQSLKSSGINTPIIADVHFNPTIAEMLAPFVEKIRINPGNYVDERYFSENNFNKKIYQQYVDDSSNMIKPLLEKCREYSTALRIGINHGSLSKRMVSRFGNTPTAMAQSAMEWIEICESHNFTNLVLSLKASNVHFMLESYFLLEKMMEERGNLYPLHIGVTEAGNGIEGRAKSAAGIGALLLNGLGDTLRVSLTEEPAHEIIFGKKIVQAIHDIQPDFYYINENKTLNYTHHESDKEKFLAEVSAVCCYENYKNPIKDLKIVNQYLSEKEILNLEKVVLQAVGIKYFAAEFISCPSCSRTQYNIEELTTLVKEKFSSFCGIKIAIMGCVVNGPGEMADAHYGVIGCGKNRVVVYKGKNPISKDLPTDQALQLLEEIITSEHTNNLV